MKRSVFLIRHAEQEKDESPGAGIWQPKAPLKPGSSQRIQVAADYFAKEGIVFHRYWHSALTRAVQTCEILWELTTKSSPDLAPMSDNLMLGPSRIGEWEAGYERWRLAQADPAKPPLLDAPGFLKIMPDLIRTQALRTFQAVKTIATQLPNKQNAAAISHIPLIPLAEWCATGTTLRTHVEYCQAIEFVFEDDSVVSTKVHLY
ncbi:MAG: histidine phosphatase family protein [Patescibacteria group bacterium]